jgi:uncharacterized phage infection (PIP) family protein YhgE
VAKEQQAKITHLEQLVEDLVGRIAALEDKANQTEATTSKSTRAKTTTTPTKLAAQVKDLEDRTDKIDDRLQEVEIIVEQLNDNST